MTQTQPSTPPNTRIYAVGDIHGRLDLLMKLEDRIMEDAARNSASRKVVVYLGDYVDRGTQSRQVIEHLIAQPLEGFETVYLRGNHEDAMLRFMEGEAHSDSWLLWGGDATLRSYNTNLRDKNGNAHPMEELSALFSQYFP
ncbi:MAG: serine/threonine protein phosphatase, partial [Rickettsiales bacterium]|nr:serine/threonine protein phosphatase [Rickettsiales bacterium]